jgi:hypothetical protein
MLKENYFNSFILLAIGILIIYTINTPPTVILKYSKFDNMKNVNYIVNEDILSHNELCIA